MVTFMFYSDFRYWVGGKKKNNGRFSYFEEGRMRMGSNHVPMTKNDRMRFLNCMQKGRKTN